MTLPDILRSENDVFLGFVSFRLADTSEFPFSADLDIAEVFSDVIAR